MWFDSVIFRVFCQRCLASLLPVDHLALCWLGFGAVSAGNSLTLHVLLLVAAYILTEVKVCVHMDTHTAVLGMVSRAYTL